MLSSTRWQRWHRRLLGANGIAAAWVMLWVPLGALAGLLFGVVVAVFDGNDQRFLYLFLGPIIGSLLGFVLGWCYGGLFALILGLFERAKTLEQLPTWRVVCWGGLPGFLFGVLLARIIFAAELPRLLPFVLNAGILWSIPGALTAWLVLKLARRGAESA